MAMDPESHAILEHDLGLITDEEAIVIRRLMLTSHTPVIREHVCHHHASWFDLLQRGLLERGVLFVHPISDVLDILEVGPRIFTDGVPVVVWVGIKPHATTEELLLFDNHTLVLEHGYVGKHAGDGTKRPVCKSSCPAVVFVIAWDVQNMLSSTREVGESRMHLL